MNEVVTDSFIESIPPLPGEPTFITHQEISADIAKAMHEFEEYKRDIELQKNDDMHFCPQMVPVFAAWDKGVEAMVYGNPAWDTGSMVLGKTAFPLDGNRDVKIRDFKFVKAGSPMSVPGGPCTGESKPAIKFDPDLAARTAATEPPPWKPITIPPDAPPGSVMEGRVLMVPDNNGLRFKIKDGKASMIEEADPTGRKPSDPGAKLDAGKVRLGLVLGGFADALMAVGEIGTFGAAKYTDDGWKSVPDARKRYMDAGLRHQLKHLGGEELDQDSGLPHLAHSAWNALAVLQKYLEARKAIKNERKET